MQLQPTRTAATHTYSCSPQLQQQRTRLAAARRAAAAHAAVAASVAYHDGAADVAAGGVAQVYDIAEQVGGMGGFAAGQFRVSSFKFPLRLGRPRQVAG